MVYALRQSYVQFVLWKSAMYEVMQNSIPPCMNKRSTRQMWVSKMPSPFRIAHFFI